jgi:hypothetical protein
MNPDEVPLPPTDDSVPREVLQPRPQPDPQEGADREDAVETDNLGRE